MLKNKLLEDGIDADRIEVITDEQEATSKALQIAEPGDLLLVLADNIKRTWKQIIYFNSEARVDEIPKKAPVSVALPATDDFTLDESLQIISDERGVRIALVHPGGEQEACAELEPHDLHYLARVADPDAALYRAFDLRVAPKTLFRRERRLPGALLLAAGEEQRGFRARRMSERPDYDALI